LRFLDRFGAVRLSLRLGAAAVLDLGRKAPITPAPVARAAAPATISLRFTLKVLIFQTL